MTPTDPISVDSRVFSERRKRPELTPSQKVAAMHRVLAASGDIGPNCSSAVGDDSSMRPVKLHGDGAVLLVTVSWRSSRSTRLPLRPGTTLTGISHATQSCIRDYPLGQSSRRARWWLGAVDQPAMVSTMLFGSWLKHHDGMASAEEGATMQRIKAELERWLRMRR